MEDGVLKAPLKDFGLVNGTRAHKQRRVRRSRAEWAELVRQYYASGETLVGFAARLKLNASSLSYHLGTSGRARRRKRSRRVEIPAQNTATARDTAASDSSNRLTLIFSNGVEVTFPAEMEGRVLRALIEK